jgi:hypothetical protein
MTDLAEMIEKGIPEIIEQPEEKPDLQQQIISLDTSLKLPETMIEYPITDFSTWFNKHYQKFSNLRLVRVSISGVDASDNIIITVPTLEKDESDEPRRKIKIFENAKQSKILDADPIGFNVFNNGYMITYKLSDHIIIKGYGVKTGMFLTICHLINNLIIPLSMMKITRKDTTVKIKVSNLQETINKLPLVGDVETLQILYSQSIKHTNHIKTKQDIVEWFSRRQTEVEDVNHHLQIDEVLLKLI